MSIVNVSDFAVLGFQSNNRNRVDHNNFGGDDNSNSKSFNRSRGHRSKSHGRKNGGRKDDCKH
jgi:hypothetical protein